MATTFVSAFIHLTFWKKKHSPELRPQDKPGLCLYIGGIIKNIGGTPIIINGTIDHLHVLSTLPKTISISAFAKEIKQSSSKWIKTKDPLYYKEFFWQRGFGGFTADGRKIEGLKAYISNQEVHHQSLSYRKELLLLLRGFNIDFNPDYLCE